MFKLHRYRERNTKITEQKKRQFKLKNGALFCENCDFDFEKEFGFLGMDFIEVHHIKPLHLLTEHSLTKLEDLMLLCSNCHRMIHRIKDFDLKKLKISLRKQTNGL